MIITPKYGYIGLYTGVNTKLSPMVYVDVNLGNDSILEKISEYINSMDTGTAGELKKIFEKAEVKFTGLTTGGKTYSSTQSPKEAGVHVATAFVGGDSNYRAEYQLEVSP